MSTLKSEFITLRSLNTTDFQPLDLAGAKQVVIRIHKNFVAGRLTNEPFATSEGFSLEITDTFPITINSTDDRLYFVSKSAALSAIEVWIIRG